MTVILSLCGGGGERAISIYLNLSINWMDSSQKELLCQVPVSVQTTEPNLNGFSSLLTLKTAANTWLGSAKETETIGVHCQVK